MSIILRKLSIWLDTFFLREHITASSASHKIRASGEVAGNARNQIYRADEVFGALEDIWEKRVDNV
jgi:hypothetical protein